MKLKTLTLKNFRGYKDPVTIEFGNLTAFVGKNDIGKSTILEALDIFFNNGKGIIKIEQDDINKKALADNDIEIMIAVTFGDLPEFLVIDATNTTTLRNEYLLNEHGDLEVIKKYPNAGKEKVFIKANHPTHEGCNDLLLKKNADLKKIIEQKAIPCEDRVRNAIMRAAIWKHYHDELDLQDIEIDVTKGDTAGIWDKLQTYLPLYSLFQSDRKNSDGDSEVQDPLKEAVKQLLKDEGINGMFREIAERVEGKLQDVSNRTLAKLREMNPEIADTLSPVIPKAEDLKWAEVFKGVKIASDDDIPINKRGSGVKRLILLNFFRAEAERRKKEENFQSVIYGIEEPETSQHTENQKLLIKAFIALSESQNTQIVLTTHSANVVKALKFENLRLIRTYNGNREVNAVERNLLRYPSLNEVNFIAFGDVTEEYHNELYGYIEAEGKLANYKNGKQTLPYKKENRNGELQNLSLILTEYVRHQIHHPENKKNVHFTPEQLSESIQLMRTYIGTFD